MCKEIPCQPLRAKALTTLACDKTIGSAKLLMISESVKKSASSCPPVPSPMELRCRLATAVGTGTNV